MANKPSRLQHMLKENLMLKVLALTLALLTIGVVRRLTSQEEEFEIPITIRVEPGFAILDQDARTAYITCRGAVDDLRRIDARNVRVVARPEFGGEAGSEQVPIGPRNVEGWLRGVTVKRVRPDLVTVTLDREIESQVAVARPEILGVPRIGRAEVEHTPRYVTVKGPQSRIEDMKILRPEPVDVSGAVDAFTVQLKVLTEGDQWTYQIVPERVTARVNIVTESVSRIWTNLPVRAMLDTAQGQVVSMVPSMVDVSLRGSPEMMDVISREHVKVFVDCVGLPVGIPTLTAVQVHLPPGVEVSTAAHPKTITITVTVMERSEDAVASETET